uniref:Uncharacterized protein n=1 Tax=Physcomitrium patens TaxID=3218 RepID=A0A2K1JT08_PHYPA|nr:hypothetical protein PHYPA_014443 [Physcomitrium patens]
MVLGHISGRTPGARKLAIWARANPQILLSTHDSFEEYFEVQFTQEDGRRRTLADLRYTLEGRDIIFYSWSPYFNADLPLNKAHLKTGFWAQIRELPPFLRTQEFLRETFEVFSEVLYIDDEDTYLTKLSGPRVRILTENVKTLPKTLLIPRLDGGSDIEYTLEYSGLKSQCSRCRSFEHTIQQCTIHRIPNTQRLNRQPSHNTNRGRAPSTSTSGIGKNQPTQSHKQATQWQSFPANIQERLSRGLQQTSTLSETEGKTLGDFLGYNPEETPEESSNIGDCQNRESVTPEADKPND